MQKWQTKANAQDIKVLMAALITTDTPEATLTNLAAHELNLYRALTPQHLGKAMATSWVDWNEMTKWTTLERQVQSSEGTSPASPAQAG